MFVAKQGKRLSSDFAIEARGTARVWRTFPSYRSMWQALLNNTMSGDYRPIVSRAVVFGDADKGTPTQGLKFIAWPLLIIDAVGQRHWGMVIDVGPQSQCFLNTWSLRDQLTIKDTPASITVVAVADGAILWQNAASMAAFGERPHIP